MVRIGEAGSGRRVLAVRVKVGHDGPGQTRFDAIGRSRDETSRGGVRQIGLDQARQGETSRGAAGSDLADET